MAFCRILVLMVVVTLTIVPLIRASDHMDAEEIIADLCWLAGSWVGNFEGNLFEAYYTSPEGGTILSVSKEFSDNGPCYIEFEKFSVEDGQVILRPYPGGKPSVPFMLTDYDPELRVARFENLNHDFPTDITYRKISDDSLKILVGGPHNRQRKVLTVELTRKK